VESETSYLYWSAYPIPALAEEERTWHSVSVGGLSLVPITPPSTFSLLLLLPSSTFLPPCLNLSLPPPPEDEARPGCDPRRGRSRFPPSDSSQTPPEQEKDLESVVKKENAADQELVNDDEPRYDYPTGLQLASILTDVIMTYYFLFLDLIIIFIATSVITIEFDSLKDIDWYAKIY